MSRWWVNRRIFLLQVMFSVYLVKLFSPFGLCPSSSLLAIMKSPRKLRDAAMILISRSYRRLNTSMAKRHALLRLICHSRARTEKQCELLLKPLPKRTVPTTKSIAAPTKATLTPIKSKPLQNLQPSRLFVGPTSRPTCTNQTTTLAALPRL